MTFWSLVFMASTAFAALGFVVVAVLWLRKLRETISTALGETAGQQLRSSQILHDKITHLQTQQMLHKDRLEDLTAANNQLRKELGQLAGRVNTEDKKANSSPRHLH